MPQKTARSIYAQLHKAGRACLAVSALSACPFAADRFRAVVAGREPLSSAVPVNRRAVRRLTPFP
jgi:hypothetical protein